MEISINSCCGLDCQSCSFRESHGCKGCIATGGNPFHGSCALAQCVLQKGKRFCGECEEILTCQLLRSYAFDPQHGDNGERIQRCQALKQALVQNAREGLDPIGYCGHHCDYCPYTPWCGGCRSDYSCCSFATLFPDGVCPNLGCAKERGLDGCFDCPQLESCQKGYFGADDGYTAKAASLMIQKLGKEGYNQLRQRFAKADPDSPSTLSRAGSLPEAIKLLGKYSEKDS